MRGGREAGHVDADLGDDALGGPFPDPGDGVEPVTGLAKGSHHPVDHLALVELGDRRFEVVEVIQDHSQHDAWCSRNRPRSASRSAGILLRSTPLASSASTSGRVRRPPGPQHQPARHAQHVRGDRVELDPGVLEHLLHPLLLGGVGLDQPLAVAGQVPQLADLGRGHERPRSRPCSSSWASHAASARSVLRPGHHLHVLGVHQPQVEPAVLQHVPDRLPVRAGRFHHHLGHAVGGQPVASASNPDGERHERPRLRRRPRPDGDGVRTQPTTSSLPTSSPAHRSTSTSTATSSRDVLPVGSGRANRSTKL